MITVEHIQASINHTGQRIDTLVCSYPRAIHAQLLTHRVFSKNSSSTRAIPLQKAIDQLDADPAEYIWTQNQAGMQGELITDDKMLHAVNDRFRKAKEDAVFHAHKLLELGVHKQNAGRLLEPFQNIRIVLTSTEWDNWDWLRDDPAAQGEIAELARKIKAARDAAEPMELNAGEWHVPFVDRVAPNQMRYYSPIDHSVLTVEEAKLVSMSVCAQTSYRNADYSLTKAKEMYEKLTGSKKMHASPFEHQAMGTGLINVPDLQPDLWPVGITHMDREGHYWSGNFKGFIQHRQLLKGHDHAKG